MQGDSNWKAARRGKITASRFGDAMAKRGTRRREKLIEDTVDELLGLPMFEDGEEPWFNHGRVLEPEARGLYEWERDVEVIVPDFIPDPKRPYIGCSPDGLVHEGGIEIKCRAKMSIWMAKKGMDSVYKPQVQGNMWVTGRDWWDFVDYYRNFRQGDPQGHMRVTRIYRDDAYITKLEKACDEVWAEVQERLSRVK